ncbi:PREDICTED: apyrase-like [Rhagoletis zephyria]|uniref:apyrase-like n=1 Tax=Rhagoletis zephyria TaxID=28612 RepID=UPI000811AAA4|nr:PREDICTED: apyrase-like [Rhagoletis zephyria]
MSFHGRIDSSYTNPSHNTATPVHNSSFTYRQLDSTPRTSHHTGSSHSRSVMYTRDWRSALRTPPTYRIGNRTLRFNYHFALLVACAFILCFLFVYVRTGSQSSSDAAWLKSYSSSTHSSSFSSSPINGDAAVYSDKYPLTPPLVTHASEITYRIAMVADLDTNSKVVKKDGSLVWRSFLKKGYLIYRKSKPEITIKWDEGEPISLESSFSLKGRGMELSELVTFNGKLLSFDDRTGLIYDLTNEKPIPWIILLDGNGLNSKGFKAEWATVKDQQLYVGSMGKEWTTSAGDFENENPMYVKVISQTGEVRSVDWAFNFKYLRQEAMQISWPGYMIHESGTWSSYHKKWYFLPRRCSREKYNETRDEHMGCNLLISADERFTKIHTVPLDASNSAPTHGFSSFKFVPNTEDKIIVALKTEELDGKTSTYITAFDVEGHTIFPEQRIETDLKYEGFEFI